MDRLSAGVVLSDDLIAKAEPAAGSTLPHPALEAGGHTDALGQTAENVAERRGVSRQDQDALALLSQQKAGRAIDSGRLAEEISPVNVPSLWTLVMMIWTRSVCQMPS